jgi:hypothetical protein
VRTEKEERQCVIWGINAWVGSECHRLSAEAAGRIFDIAVRDELPDVTDTEIAATMAELKGFRDGLAK